MRRFTCTVLVLAAILGVASCGTKTKAPAVATGTPRPTATVQQLRKITFMAGFRPQANLAFVAVYLADAKGYFADEGLQVAIKHSAGQDEHLKLLLSKDIQFTTATGAQALSRYADGIPVRAVALFGQRGDQGFVARADSGIRTPADFKGHTVGFKSGVVPTELDAMLASAGLTRSDIKLQAVGFDPRLFIERGVDVYPVFLSNEPYAIRKAGVDIKVFDPADYGVATLGLTFLAHSDTVVHDPDLVRHFLRASLRGAQYAVDHPDEAVQTTLKYADGADPGQQRFLLDADIASARRPDGMGRATAAQWEALEATLRQYGVLTKPAGGAAVFAGSIADSLYDSKGQLK